MVEARDILPALDRMASRAGQRLPVFSQGGHSSIELSVMRVLVAGGAGQVPEVELRANRLNLVSVEGAIPAVTIRAEHCRVRSVERETCRAVFGQEKDRGEEACDRMALLTTVRVIARKLALVGVGVAVGASFPVDPIARFGTARLMALRAGDDFVLTGEGELGGCVLCRVERRRLKRLDRVAF